MFKGKVIMMLTKAAPPPDKYSTQSGLWMIVPDASSSERDDGVDWLSDVEKLGIGGIVEGEADAARVAKLKCCGSPFDEFGCCPTLPMVSAIELHVSDGGMTEFYF